MTADQMRNLREQVDAALAAYTQQKADRVRVLPGDFDPVHDTRPPGWITQAEHAATQQKAEGGS